MGAVLVGYFEAFVPERVDGVLPPYDPEDALAPEASTACVPEFFNGLAVGGVDFRVCSMKDIELPCNGVVVEEGHLIIHSDLIMWWVMV